MTIQSAAVSDGLLDRAVLTLSSTLRHLSAPHKDATRFSLSSSWLRFCTHSLTVATQHTRHMTITHPESCNTLKSPFENTCTQIQRCKIAHPSITNYRRTFVYNVIQASQESQFFFEPIPGSFGGKREQCLHGKVTRLQQKEQHVKSATICKYLSNNLRS